MDLKRRLEASGYGAVDIMPSMFVAVAKNPDGTNVALIVNSDSLRTLELGTDDAAEPCTVGPNALRQMN